MRITVTNLTRTYGKVLALNHLSFSMEGNEIIGLVGPNGAGKSTLFRLMSGREVPNSGDILLDGVSVLEHPVELLPQIGFMPDTLPPTSSWTVGPYLDFYARANNLAGAARQNALDETIALMKLETFLDRKLDALSKGMKQRVSLARVLLSQPRLLLLDEPSAGLDPNARIELREIFRTLAAKGIVLVISSHILSDLEELCDGLLILEKGALRWAGKLSEWHGNTSAQGQVIALEFAQRPDGVEAILKNLPHFTSCRVAGRKTVEVTLEGGEKERNEFMAAVFGTSLPTTGMHVVSDSIEQMFLKSTSGNLQ